MQDLIPILRNAHVIAVVGCSDNPDRDSHRIAAYLIAQGYTVYPVNPTIESVLGRVSLRSLADVPEHVDIVVVFRRPEFAMDVAKESLAVGAGAVIYQPGATDRNAVQFLEASGVSAFPESCIRVAHSQMKYLSAEE